MKPGSGYLFFFNRADQGMDEKDLLPWKKGLPKVGNLSPKIGMLYASGKFPWVFRIIADRPV